MKRLMYMRNASIFFVLIFIPFQISVASKHERDFLDRTAGYAIHILL